jgi:hypothetical protein
LHFKEPKFDHHFFHGIVFGEKEEWKETWTTRLTSDRKKGICWPKIWLSKDLNDNVQILSLSYDSNVVASVHNDVTKISKSLVQILVKNSRCDNLPIYAYLIHGYVFQ